MQPPLPSRHVIRLRGFWRSFSHPAGSAWERHFGRPVHSDPTETIWLVTAHLPPNALLYLNEQLVGTASPEGNWSGDVTSLLQPRNRLCVLIPAYRCTSDNTSSLPETIPDVESEQFLVELHFRGLNSDQ